MLPDRHDTQKQMGASLAATSSLRAVQCMDTGTEWTGQQDTPRSLLWAVCTQCTEELVLSFVHPRFEMKLSELSHVCESFIPRGSVFPLDNTSLQLSQHSPILSLDPFLPPSIPSSLPSPILQELHRLSPFHADTVHTMEWAAALSKRLSLLQQGCGWEWADISLFHPLLSCPPPPPSPLPSSPHSHTDTHRGPSLGDAPVPVRLRLPILCFLCLTGQGVKLLQYRPARSSRSH